VKEVVHAAPRTNAQQHSARTPQSRKRMAMPLMIGSGREAWRQPCGMN
jgi:hypothetical protein